jgi:hypothetical protein
VLHSLNLTTPGIGHSEVHVWYQDNVVPLLKTATPFVTGPVDAPLSASSTSHYVAFGYYGVLARMTDDDPTSHSSDFTATINWGDGSSSKATVHGTDLLGYYIAGTHYYAENSNYSYIVKFNDRGGASTTTSGTISVSPRRRH